MKIVVITGSPHKHGTSATLADSFAKGATESGHEIYRFDAAFKTVSPCLDCGKCRMGSDGCVQQDDMAELAPKLLEADVVCFATPVYYLGICAQLKTVIDRFFAIDSALKGNKKMVTLITLADSAEHTAAATRINFKEIADYLQWEQVGEVVAYGCPAPMFLEKTNYADAAYKLGRDL